MNNVAGYMDIKRKPMLHEEKLLEALIKKSTIPIHSDWNKGLMVCPMNDGGMGSLLLFPNGEIKKGRKFGKRISELQFKDQDGVDVIASLNTDQDCDLFELDIWKTDFSKLISLSLRDNDKDD